MSATIMIAELKGKTASRLRICWALLAGLLIVQGSLAEACGNLSPYGRRRAAEHEAHELRFTWMVQGRWQQEAGGDAARQSGTVISLRGRRETGRYLADSGSDVITCGFPAYPEDGDAGTFYLRRNGDRWRIVHFRPDTATVENSIRRARQQSQGQ